MTDAPQYVIVFTDNDGNVIVDDFPNSDLRFTQNRAKERGACSPDLGGTYRVAELRYVDKEER